jgi:autophagy-related protein 11
MLEVEDWTQPGTSKRRQASKKASIPSESRENPPVSLSAPPEDEVEESFHPSRAPNSRHFPNATAPVAGPSSLSRLLAQASSTSEAVPPDPMPLAPVSDVAPIRTPSPPHAALSSSPAQSHPATTAPGRPQHSSSPLRPGSRNSRISTSSRFSAPRLPAFGGAGGNVAKAVPTTAITAPPGLDEPVPGALGPIPTTAPLPSDTASEGMASLLARRRTTSFHVPASGSPLAAPEPRQPVGPAAAFASLASWGTTFSRRRKADAAQHESSSASTQTAARQDSAAGKTDAQRILQRF